MNYITNVNEALEEARRLTKVRGRDVEAKAIDCTCDYSAECFYCAASGTYYVLVFAFCNHLVGDCDDVQCDANDCARKEREASMVERVDTFPRVGAPLQSCAHVQIERDEQEAA